MSAESSDGVAQLSSGWRFNVGVALFILAILLWLLVPVASGMDVPGSTIAAMTGVIFVANKVLLLLIIAVMGKAGFQQLKGKVFGYAKGLAPADTVGPVRYAIGLVMFCLPILTSWLEPYIDQIWPGLRPDLWQLQLAGDIMLVASFFVLGGNFWDKVRSLFVRTARVVYPVGA